MRLVYLDEAGVSREPYVVVAGIITDPDKQHVQLEKYLASLVEEHVPAESRTNFRFHATDLFHGSGTFDRRRFSREDRWAILDKLVQIPAKFRLPVTFGPMNRAQYIERHGERLKNDVAAINSEAHAVAYSVAVVAVERWMRDSAGPDEVAMIIAEDNSQSRQFVRKMHDLWRDTKRVKNLSSYTEGYLPFERIREDVYFAEKRRSSLLQIADTCAFAIRRRISGSKHAERFFEPLIPALVMVPANGKTWDSAGLVD